MVRALRDMPAEIDIKAAGTAMRFMTAYLCVTPGEYVLTGTERMKQRPIRILVNALRYLGADIRSEEHTSELQSRQYLVCRLLLEKTNIRGTTVAKIVIPQV